MQNLQGVQVWVWLVCVAIIFSPTLWKIKQGTVGGFLSVTLSVLSGLAEFAGFLVLIVLHPFLLHLPISILLMLSGWLLDTWAKRAKALSRPGRINL